MRLHNPQGFHLERGRQVIVETGVLRYLRRTLGPLAENLVAYYAPESKKFCIAIWIDRTSGRVKEIFSYSGERSVTREQIALVPYFLRGAHRSMNRKMLRALWEDERSQRREKDDKVRESANRRRWATKRRLITNRNDVRNLIAPAIPRF